MERLSQGWTLHIEDEPYKRRTQYDVSHDTGRASRRPRETHCGRGVSTHEMLNMRSTGDERLVNGIGRISFARVYRKRGAISRIWRSGIGPRTCGRRSTKRRLVLKMERCINHSLFPNFADKEQTRKGEGFDVVQHCDQRMQEGRKCWKCWTVKLRIKWTVMRTWPSFFYPPPGLWCAEPMLLGSSAAMDFQGLDRPCGNQVIWQ